MIFYDIYNVAVIYSPINKTSILCVCPYVLQKLESANFYSRLFCLILKDIFYPTKTFNR